MYADKGFTCVGSLDDFFQIHYAYRAEIEFCEEIYKLWRESNDGYRLEIFDPQRMEPTRIYVIPKGSDLGLPLPLWESEQWIIFGIAIPRIA